MMWRSANAGPGGTRTPSPASGESSTGARSVPQLLDQSHHLGVGRKIQLGPKQICMLLGAPNRRRAITNRYRRLGEVQYRLRVVGIQVGGATPPLQRLARCCSSRREQAKRLRTSFRKSPALVISPPLEPGRLPQKEAVEKRTRV